MSLSLGLALLALTALLGVLLGLGVLEYQRRRANERQKAIFQENYDLNEELGGLHRKFLAQQANLPDDQRTLMWKPVSDAVSQAVAAIGREPYGNSHLAHLRRAVELARPLVKDPS